MKILLVVQKYNLFNRPDFKYLFPVGIAYISAVLKKAGYDVDCLNMNHYHGSPEEILIERLIRHYDVIGIGGNSLDYPIIEEIFKVIRTLAPKAVTILGGPIITTEPELIYGALRPTFGVLGEGEETILELVGAFEGKYQLHEVNGIIYSEGDKIILTSPRPEIADLDSIPFPDMDGFGFEEQLRNTYTNSLTWTTVTDNARMYPVVTSRGCPFKCTFCYHFGKYRFRSLPNVMEEIRLAVSKYNITVIFIYDDCLSAKKQRLFDFCAEIIKLKSEISWELSWMGQLIVNTVNEDILSAMKDAGCSMISYGFESYSPIVLKSMKKNITPQQIDFAFKMTLKHKIAIQANFIFGDAAETKDSSECTLEYWEKNCEGQVWLDFIQPYPGSNIYEHCVNKGLIKDKLQFIKNGVAQFFTNMTNNMSEEEFSELKYRINHLSEKYHRYVIPIEKSQKNGSYSITSVCPFCSEKNVYKNCMINNAVNYGFIALCRNCYKKYQIVSTLQYIIYKKFRPLIIPYLNIRRKVRWLLLKKNVIFR